SPACPNLVLVLTRRSIFAPALRRRAVFAWRTVLARWSILSRRANRFEFFSLVGRQGLREFFLNLFFPGGDLLLLIRGEVEFLTDEWRQYPARFEWRRTLLAAASLVLPRRLRHGGNGAHSDDQSGQCER